MSRDEHMNSYTIFQCAQLLEGFEPLAGRLRPVHKSQQRMASKTIDALVTENPDGFACWQDALPGKIEGGSVRLHGDFDLMRRCQIGLA